MGVGYVYSYPSILSINSCSIYHIVGFSWEEFNIYIANSCFECLNCLTFTFIDKDEVL